MVAWPLAGCHVQWMVMSVQTALIGLRELLIIIATTKGAWNREAGEVRGSQDRAGGR